MKFSFIHLIGFRVDSASGFLTSFHECEYN